MRVQNFLESSLFHVCSHWALSSSRIARAARGLDVPAVGRARWFQGAEQVLAAVAFGMRLPFAKPEKPIRNVW
jgi:hypothetical protein